jgi:hypothetical protein
MAKHSVFVASRQAAVDLWGQAGLDAIGALLPDDARRDTVESALVAVEWLPERYVLAWHEAVWRGPARTNEAELHRFLHRAIDSQFGRVRRVLLRLIKPTMVAERAAEFWRYEHTHGTMTATQEESGVRVTLRDHPFVGAPLSRMVLAESLRYAMTLTRVREVTGTHHVDRDGALQVRLRWP